jgi:spore maturation protein CgeB
MRILFVGGGSGTGLQRLLALQRVGHEVFPVDPLSYLPANRLLSKWINETGAWGISKLVERRVLGVARGTGMSFDLVWVDSGYVIGSDLVRMLKRQFGLVVSYNNDNPFARYGWNKWRQYRECIHLFDLIAMRHMNIDQLKYWGAKAVLGICMTADEVIHKPVSLAAAELEFWSSDVCFVGNWMPERGPFMARLLQRGIPISIWGDRWHKAKEWRRLKPAWRGPGVHMEDYVKPLLAAKICLGLLSKDNCDLHTRRSVEIPAVRALLCAERTSEHLRMYEEGMEAMFWGDVDECASICAELLEDPERRKEIAGRGHERCIKNGYFNETMVNEVISHATERV